jgi:hypothetical protein
MTLAERLRDLAALLPDDGSVTLPVRDIKAWIAADGLAPGVAAAAADNGADEWLTAEQCAERLQVSVRWVYDHGVQLGRRQLSRRCVRFSARALARQMARKS